MTPPKPALTENLLGWLRSIAPVLALGCVFVLFWFLDRVYSSGRFGTTANIAIILTQSSFVAVAALGMAIVIATGGIDLSAGAILGLSSATLAYGMKQYAPNNAGEEPTMIAIVMMFVAVWVGLLCGLWNGTLISSLKLPPFIVTLGSTVIFIGLALLLAKQTTIKPSENQMPTWFKDFVSPEGGFKSWGGIAIPSTGIFFVVILAAVVAFLFTRTVFGRHILAIGSNEVAANLSGIRVGSIRTLVYGIGGAFFGLAGVYYFTLVQNYTARSGTGYELDAIAAVVIGGGSLRGGKVAIVGAMAGSLLMAVIRSGCIQLSIDRPYQEIILGAVIIVAVVADQLFSGRRE